jgi:hypothetical protein
MSRAGVLMFLDPVSFLQMIVGLAIIRSIYTRKMAHVIVTGTLSHIGLGGASPPGELRVTINTKILSTRSNDLRCHGRPFDGSGADGTWHTM